MPNRVVIAKSLAGAGLAVLFAGPARAELTVIGRYVFDRETLIRPLYFSTRHVRVSTPDGREVVFDSHTGHVTLVDHAGRVYWSGPLARADSIAAMLDVARWDMCLRLASDTVHPEWVRDVALLGDSARAAGETGMRMIAGYPCDPVLAGAGAPARVPGWVAPVPVEDDRRAGIGDQVLSAVLNPARQAVMGMFWQTEIADALPLAATMTFDTPTRHARFQWHAVQVIAAQVPDSTWQPPAGYRRLDAGAARLAD